MSTSIYTVKQSKIIAITLIIILGIFLIYSLRTLFTAILGAVVIYVLFKPMLLYLTDKRKMKRVLSIITVMLTSILILIMPFTILIWMLTNKILYYKDHPEIINKIVTTTEKFIGENFDKSTVQDALNNAGSWIAGMIPSFFDSAFSLLLTLAMMYFFLYYMFKKYEVFEETLIKYMPFRQKNSEHFGEELKNMTHANIIGQGIISFAQAVLLGIGFVIFGIEDPIFWSLICFFLSFLPVIGSAGVFVPAGLIELASGNSFGGYGIIIFGFLAVSNIDNLLRLWLNKWLGDIHPLITITGIIIGLPLFGILGLVFGPLLISFFLMLIRLYEAAFVERHTEKEKVVDRSEL